MRNTERFTHRVDDYTRYRPGYPQALVDFLESDCGLGQTSVVADIGAGSGQFTRMLLGRVQTVFAVEPNDAMRRAAEVRLGDRPGFVSVAASAEATRLSANSVDFVVAAQACHWFDAAQFAREARRIARSGAHGVLVWNVRREKGNEFLREYKQLLLRHCEERHLITARRDDPARLAVFYAGSAYGCRRFEYRQSLDFSGLLGRVCSSSYAPRPDQPAYSLMVADLRALFERFSRQGSVAIDYETRVYAGRLARQGAPPPPRQSRARP